MYGSTKRGVEELEFRIKGTLTMKELRKLFNFLRIPVSDEDLTAFLKRYGSKSQYYTSGIDGEILKRKLLEGDPELQKLKKIASSLEGVIKLASLFESPEQLFNTIDFDNDGFIDSFDLYEEMIRWQIKTNTNELNFLLRYKFGTAVIDYDTFKNWTEPWFGVVGAETVETFGTYDV